MTRPVQIGGTALLALAAAAGIGALSRVPYDAVAGDGALIRLSWRFRNEPETECRRLPPEELAKLPIHMRQAEECAGKVAPFLLTVTLDGAAVAHDTVRPHGARADRPLYVYREFQVEPGEHALHVAFLELDVARVAQGRSPEARAAEESEREEAEEEREGRRERDEHGVTALELDTQLRIARREVALVTYDAELGRLLVRRGSVGGQVR
ncbi:MAG: hypothetical protein HY704_00095 [Gemmatimonadetes bacterium]|nr:hypothetical protein [Gemmatimonadota bacterium]